MEKYNGPIYRIKSNEELKNLATTFGWICGGVSIASLGGYIGSYIKVDSAFVDFLREGRKQFLGSTLGTAALTGIVSTIRENKKDKIKLLKKINGNTTANPATTNEECAAYECSRRNEQNKAYTKDIPTSVTILAISLLGLALTQSKPEESSKFIDFIKKIGELPFMATAGTSIVTLLSTLSKILKNGRENDLIQETFEITDAGVEAHEKSMGNRDSKPVQRVKVQPKVKTTK